MPPSIVPPGQGVDGAAGDRDDLRGLRADGEGTREDGKGEERESESAGAHRTASGARASMVPSSKSVRQRWAGSFSSQSSAPSTQTFSARL